MANTSFFRRVLRGDPGSGPPMSDGLQARINGKYLFQNLAPRPRFNPKIEAPIDGDQRVPVAAMERSPWRRLVHLGYNVPIGGRPTPCIGTGWVAGPRTIITAGHCLWDYSGSDKSADMRLAVGRVDKDNAPWGVIEVEPDQYEFHPEWKRRFDLFPENARYDIGCIHLKEPLHKDIGRFSIGVIDSETLIGMEPKAVINVAGYPRIKPPSGDGVPNERILPYMHNDVVISAENGLVNYRSDTSGGQSGSPIWMVGPNDDDPTVIGVHAWGVRDEKNSAVHIDDALFDLIKGWLKKDEPEPPVA